MGARNQALVGHKTHGALKTRECHGGEASPIRLARSTRLASDRPAHSIQTPDAAQKPKPTTWIGTYPPFDRNLDARNKTHANSVSAVERASIQPTDIVVIGQRPPDHFPPRRSPTACGGSRPSETMEWQWKIEIGWVTAGRLKTNDGV